MSNNPDTIAIFALVVSIFSIAIGFSGLLIQRRHNILSVRPIGNIGLFQSPNTIGIHITNNGTGPMIIKSVETENNEGIKKNYPVDWIPIEYRQFFWGNLEETSLLNGTKVDILGFKFNPNDPKEEQKRDEIRSILKSLTIHVKYTDIYNKYQPELIKKFDHFGNQTWPSKKD